MNYNDALKKDLLNKIQNSPEVVDNYKALANLFLVEKQYVEAIRIYEKLLFLEPNNFEAYLNIGSIYYFLEQYEKALFYYQKAEAINDKSFILYMNLGNTYAELGKTQLALTSYKIASLLDKTSESPLMAIAVLHLENNDFELAKICYEDVIELNPSTNNYISLAKVEIKLKNFSSAIQILENILQYDSTNFIVLQYLAFVYGLTGNYVKSEQIFSNLYSQNPSDVTTYILQGELFFELNNLEDAKNLYEKALLFAPDAFEIYVHLGNLYIAKGDYKNAIQSLNKASELCKKNPCILAQLGMAYLQARHISAAVKAYRKAIEIDKNNVEYKLLYIKIIEDYLDNKFKDNEG